MKKYITLLLLGFTFIANAQKSSIEDSYHRYFENTREIPFLHLNKTSFFPGEEIWFKAYMLEQNSQKLHKTSSNLYVSLFDEKGVLKSQQLIALKNGLGKGSFKIDTSFKGKTYYLKAATNWMKNFREDCAFVQKVDILSSEKRRDLAAKSTAKQYEFQILPEGGHLLANTINNLGLVVKDKNNRGVVIEKGIIKDQDGHIIKTFSTNQFGLGNSVLFIKKAAQYTFEAHLSDGNILTQRTAPAQLQGVNLRVTNSNSKVLTVTVKTNKESLADLEHKEYTILIHNTRAFKKQPFTFKKEKYRYSLLVNKSELPAGINIITVFNEKNRPLLERLVFVNKSSLIKNIAVNTTVKDGDSLKINVTNPLKEKLYLSASILPSNHIGNKPKNSIISSFLLKPYIKGQIQNPDYYFTNGSSKKLRDLDLLLITQGWSKYDWNEIFNAPPKTQFPFENGLRIKGSFNKDIADNQSLLVYSHDNRFITQTTVKNNQFELAETYLLKNTRINFALKGKKKFKAVLPVLQFSKSVLPERLAPEHLETNPYTTTSFTANINDVFKDYEVLDEVLVRAKKEEKELPNFVNQSFLKRNKVSNGIVGSGETVLDFLNYKGFRIRRTDSNEDNSIGVVNGQVIAPYDALGTSGSPDLSQRNQQGLNRPFRFFIDNVEIDGTWLLETTYLDEIDEIYYGNRSSANIGMNGSVQVYIYRKSPEQLTRVKNRKNSLIIQRGFAKAKEFYTPQFSSYMSDEFQKYGVIHWSPELHIDKATNKEFTIDSKLQESMIIQVQGISESGKLIYQKFAI